MKDKKFFEREGVQSVLASIICILIGLLLGFIALSKQLINSFIEFEALNTQDFEKQ